MLTGSLPAMGKQVESREVVKRDSRRSLNIWKALDLCLSLRNQSVQTTRNTEKEQFRTQIRRNIPAPNFRRDENGCSQRKKRDELWKSHGNPFGGWPGILFLDRQWRETPALPSFRPETLRRHAHWGFDRNWKWHSTDHRGNRSENKAGEGQWGQRRRKPGFCGVQGRQPLWPEKQVFLSWPGKQEECFCRAGGLGSSATTSPARWKDPFNTDPKGMGCHRLRAPNLKASTLESTYPRAAGQPEGKRGTPGTGTASWPELVLSWCWWREGSWGTQAGTSSLLRTALLKRSEEEALTFKGLLKLGKTSNKEISCHMRVVGKTGIQKLQLCFVS